MQPSKSLKDELITPVVVDISADSESDEDSSDVTLESETEEEESEEDDDGEDNDEPMEVMMKGFIASTPDDTDRDGIENLCKQLFKHWDVDVKELAGLLVEQNYVTTVMKEDEVEAMVEEDPDDANTVYGVYSMVNFKNKKDNSAVKQVVDWIVMHANKNAENGNVFKEILDMEANNNPHTPGLLIKEKVVNIPGVASGPFMKQLMNDLQEATQKGMQYNFTHFIHIAKMLRLKNQEDYFVDQDDELVHKHHTRFFDVNYPTSIDASIVFQNDKGKSMKGKAFRRIYLLTKDEMTDFMNELENLDSVHNVMQQASSSGLKV